MANEPKPVVRGGFLAAVTWKGSPFTENGDTDDTEADDTGAHDTEVAQAVSKAMFLLVVVVVVVLSVGVTEFVPVFITLKK